MTLKLTTIITVLITTSLSSCTVYLPPGDETIPSADPILVPGKATTIIDPKKKDNVAASASAAKTVIPEVKAVKSKPLPPSKQGQTFYIVKPKDTVFAVMRNTGVHWKKIIKLNDLKAPKYTIFPGQSLRIK